MVLLGRKLSLHSFWMSLPLCYLAFAFLSSVLSVDRRIAFGGSQDLHQPFPILAGYVVLFYYTYLIAGRILEEQTANRLYVFFLRSVLLSMVSCFCLCVLVGCFFLVVEGEEREERK